MTGQNTITKCLHQRQSQKLLYCTMHESGCTFVYICYICCCYVYWTRFRYGLIVKYCESFGCGYYWNKIKNNGHGKTKKYLTKQNWKGKPLKLSKNICSGFIDFPFGCIFFSFSTCLFSCFRFQYEHSYPSYSYTIAY